MLLNNYILLPITFPPAGTVVINGGFDSDTGWTKQNGSTIGSGIASIVTNASITTTQPNWSIYQPNIFLTDGSTTYTVKFKARQLTGSGNLMMCRGYCSDFDQTVTGSWADYQFTMNARSDSWSHFLVVGGRAIGDTFEIDEISAVAD